MKFGRLVQHDPRSREFAAAGPVTKRSVVWGHHAPVLDQGNLGSCTGNATAQLINTDPFIKSRTHGYLTEQDAVAIYSLGTKLDGMQGTYPPDDTGSSGLGVAKAGVKLGYFTAYKHAFGFDHFTAVLQTQPVIVGTNWYSAMMNPDSHGFVYPKGQVEGGHEYLALGVNYEQQFVTFLNSWGDGWSKQGRFFMSFASVKQLLAEQGDVTVPTGK